MLPGSDDFSTSELAREAVESFAVSSSATSGNGTENQKQLPLGVWVSTPMEPPTCEKKYDTEFKVWPIWLLGVLTVFLSVEFWSESAWIQGLWATEVGTLY